MKKIRIFHLKTFIFLVVKFSVYLNRLVLVMIFVNFPLSLLHQWLKTVNGYNHVNAFFAGCAHQR